MCIQLLHPFLSEVFVIDTIVMLLSSFVHVHSCVGKHITCDCVCVYCLLCSSKWPQTHCTAQAVHLAVSASSVLGLHMRHCPGMIYESFVVLRASLPHIQRFHSFRCLCSCLSLWLHGPSSST